jgi:hypothetical protein
MKTLDIVNWSLNTILFIVIIIIIFQRRRGNKIIKEISKRDIERQKALDDFIKARKERTEMLDTYIEKINETGHKLLKDTIQLSQQKELLVNRLKELGVTDFSFLNTESDKV